MSKSDKSKTETQSFKELMAEFETITHQFDDPEIDIEKAVVLHARGVELLALLEDRLNAAEKSLASKK